MSTNDSMVSIWSNLPTEIRIFRLLLASAQQLRNWMDGRLAEVGLTTQQAILLTIIDDLGGSANLGRVASALGVTHQNAKKIAASLESKGFLKISVDEADRRVRRLEVTVQSRRFWKQRDDADESAIRDRFREFTQDELDIFVRLLLKLIDVKHRNT